MALSGDGGMLATARIREDLYLGSLDWISTVKSRDIRQLPKAPVPSAGRVSLQPTVLVSDQVAEIGSPGFPGDRPQVCRTPRLQPQRERAETGLFWGFPIRSEVRLPRCHDAIN